MKYDELKMYVVRSYLLYLEGDFFLNDPLSHQNEETFKFLLKYLIYLIVFLLRINILKDN